LNKGHAENPGVLIVLSAPSGCGKTTLVDRLLKRNPDWVRSVSVTTRKPRVGEKKGEDYHFVASEMFREMLEKKEFLESATVFDCQYGTPKRFVMGRLNEGKHVVLAIDVQGMRQIKQALISEGIRVVTCFVLPPSLKVLRERLQGRKTDSPEEIEKRIAVAQEEIKAAGEYEFSVINQNLEQTALEIEAHIEQVEKKLKEGEGKKHVLRAARKTD